VLELTEKQAEYELRLGSLVALDTAPELSDPIAAIPAEIAAQTGQPPPVATTSEAARKNRRGKF